MTSFVSIYLLIGGAHWASHLMQCSGCKHAIDANIRFALEGVVKVGGWPIQLIAYIRDIVLHRETVEDTTSFGPAIRIERFENESMEDFIARAVKETDKKMREENNNNEKRNS